MTQTPQWGDDLFVDASLLTAASAQVQASFLDLEASRFVPGIVNPAAIGISPSGLVLTITFGASARVMFGNGTLAGGFGTIDGASSGIYQENLADGVPGSGSVLVYILATAMPIGQQATEITGPPPGHPDYDPTFVPYQLYTESLDSIAVSASFSAPDNVATFELCRLTLTAGETDISSVDTSFQVWSFATARPHGQQELTGSGFFTVPSGVLELSVEGRGGGGGSGATTGSAMNNCGTTGGGGGYFRVRLTGLTAGQQIAYGVGAGGTGGQSTGAEPTAGGNTTFGSATAGGGGAGGNGTAGGPPGTGGTGGTASGGDVNLPGQAGGTFWQSGAAEVFVSGGGGGTPGYPGILPGSGEGPGGTPDWFGVAGSVALTISGQNYNGGSGQRGQLTLTF